MEFKNYINGRWTGAQSGETFETLNPATGQVIGSAPLSSQADALAAVDAAQGAYRAWRLTPAPKRGEYLYEFGRLLKARKEEISRFLTMEMGKVLPEARGDVQEAIDMAYYMASEGRRMFGVTVPSELPNKFAMAVRDSIGVCGVITPWNFPIAIPSWKIFPAIMAGNTVVFKPSGETPGLATKFVEILEETGLPAGVVNLVHGPGKEAGEVLVDHPQVKVVSFTGSTTTGRLIAERAGRLSKKVHLEMGGKNAIIVMDDADLDLALEGILWSAFGTSGQRCTAASRVIIHRAVKPQLTEKLVARASALRLGDGLQETTDVGPVINHTALEKIHRYTGIARQENAAVLIGGEPWQNGGGFFYQPTIFDQVTSDKRVFQEEIFGPCTSLVTVDSLEEAIAVNNKVEYGLSSSLYTANVNRAFQAIRDFDTGLVYINHGTIGAEIQLPFGGTKGTGNGHREAGIAGLEVFTEWKSIYVDYSGRLQRAQIDTDAVVGG